MSTTREGGPTIPAGINPEMTGTFRTAEGDIPSGYAGSNFGTARGGSAPITSGIHSASHVSATLSLKRGDPLVINTITYQYEGVISQATGEAEVFLLSNNGSKCVLKLYYPNFKPKEDIVERLKQLKHADIIRVQDYGWYNQERFFEVMEYAEGGTLDKYLPIKDINRLKGIILETINALEYCHSNDIIHKDIKPENLYFKDADGTDILVGDFGISSILDTGVSRHLTSQSLTAGYAAPEMYGIGGKVYIGKEVDYYALGITIIHIWNGKNPFDGLSIHAISNLTTSGKVRIPSDMPGDVQKLVKGLITVDYTKRWGSGEIRRWLDGENVPLHFQIVDINYPPYQFSQSESAATAEELSRILRDNWDKGRKHLYSGKISAWVNLFNPGLAVELDRIIEDDYPKDQDAGIQKAIYVLDPYAPYIHVSGEVRDYCKTTDELANVLESASSQYIKQLSSPNHAFYLYLEAHDAEKEAALFRKYFKVSPPKKALNTIILELRDRQSFKLKGRQFGSIDELLEYEDKQYLINELSDPESMLSIWIEGIGSEEIQERLEIWRKVGLDVIPVEYAVCQSISQDMANSLGNLTDNYLEALQQLASDAMNGDSQAQFNISGLYNGQFLGKVGDVLVNPIFSKIQAQWQASVDSYKTLSQKIVNNGGPDVDLDNIALAGLLLANLPGSVAYAKNLRKQAKDVIQFSWFDGIIISTSSDIAAPYLICALHDSAKSIIHSLKATKRKQLSLALSATIIGGMLGYGIGTYLGWMPAEIISNFKEGADYALWSEITEARHVWMIYLATIICSLLAIKILASNIYTKSVSVVLIIALTIAILTPITYYSKKLEDEMALLGANIKNAKEILPGTWQVGNSLMSYYPDGALRVKDDSAEVIGSWVINSGILTLKPSKKRKNPTSPWTAPTGKKAFDYLIKDIYRDKYNAKALTAGPNMYHAKRVGTSASLSQHPINTSNSTSK